jgi:hypothetical protein
MTTIAKIRMERENKTKPAITINVVRDSLAVFALYFAAMKIRREQRRRPTPDASKMVDLCFFSSLLSRKFAIAIVSKLMEGLIEGINVDVGA